MSKSNLKIINQTIGPRIIAIRGKKKGKEIINKLSKLPFDTLMLAIGSVLINDNVPILPESKLKEELEVIQNEIAKEKALEENLANFETTK